MKVLELNEKYLKLCGLISYDEGGKSGAKALKYFTNFMCLFGSFYSFVVCCFIYIYHNPSNISGVTNALLCFVCGLTSIGAYTGLLANEQNIKLLHRKLQSNADEGKLKKFCFELIIQLIFQ